MEALNLATLRRLASITSLEQEQAGRAAVFCDLCGAPICAGIRALHWNCPAKTGVPIIALASRRRPRRQRRKAS